MREGIRDDISIFGLTVNANLGFADLTSATSYLGRLGVPGPGCLGIHLLFESPAWPARHPPFVPEPRSYGSVRGTRSVAPAQPGNPADLARCRRLALGGGRLLQLAAFGVERNRRESAERDAGGARWLVLHFLERLRRQADRAVRRRVVQIHRPVEACRGRALVRLQEPPGRVLLGLRRPQPHAAGQRANHHAPRTAASIRGSTCRIRRTPT